MTGVEQSGRLARPDGVELAWTQLPGRGPTVVFLPGFRSDMAGTKAVALRDWCAARGQAMLRLDYSGHGTSGGRFEDGTIGRWRDDAALVIEARAPGPLLLVGSSMGGWIALLLARAMGARVAGLVGIAAAPDFTERMWAGLTVAERAAMEAVGYIERPTEYEQGPYRFTRALIEDGRAQRVLDAPLPIDCPMRLLHSQLDDAVPWRTALTIAEQVRATDVQATILKDGDHRLSRPQDLALLVRTVAALLGQDGA